MTYDEREILEEALRRSARWQPTESLFAQQRRFVLDRSRFKAAICSRRAGKSKGCAHKLIKSAQARPGALCLYIALTRASAKRIMWRELVKLNAQHKLGLVFNLSELTAELPNGSQIILTGAQEEADIEKWRGSAYDLVVIDEAGSFGQHIAQLVFDVLVPALMDFKGTLALIGTPNARCAGWFHDITTGKTQGWSVHRWNLLDNPHLPDARAELELIKSLHGWNEQTPVFLREYRGLWVRSDDDLVYAYDPASNDFDELPTFTRVGPVVWQHELGVDLGYRDRTAFVVLAWSEDVPGAYYVHNEAHSKMIPSAIAEKITALRSRFSPNNIVMDCGALGLSIAEEFRQRWQLPIEAADKAEKMGAIEVFNGDLRSKRLFVPDNTPLAEELKVLQYDTKGRGRDPNARKEDPHQPNDLCDAALYVHRKSRHYWHRTPANTDGPSSEAAIAALHRSVHRPSANPFEGPGDFADFGPGGDAW